MKNFIAKHKDKINSKNIIVVLLAVSAVMLYKIFIWTKYTFLMTASLFMEE